MHSSGQHWLPASLHGVRDYPVRLCRFVPLPKALETSEEADSDSGAVIAEVEEPLRITVYW